MMLDEPYRSTPWFDVQTNQFARGVLACVNDVLLMDRRILDCRPGSDIQYKGGPYKWVVYDGRRYIGGSWYGYKTRKEAIRHFVRLAMASARTGHPFVIGTVAEPEWNRIQSEFAYMP